MIESDRLRLRPWRPDDADAFDTHCNTPAVMRWLGGVLTLSALDEVVARLIRWQDERGYTFWAVERKADAAFLGFCGLKRADAPGSSVTGELEIGWRLREDAWGRGFAREAATATLDFAFDTLAADRVVALTVDGNAASWGLMQRLGMERRPELDYADARWGAELNPTIVYVMERATWRPAG